MTTSFMWGVGGEGITLAPPPEPKLMLNGVEIGPANAWFEMERQLRVAKLRLDVARDKLKKIAALGLGLDRGSAQFQADCAVTIAKSALYLTGER